MLKEIKEIKSGKKELSEFGFLVGGVLSALGAYCFWRGKVTAPYFLGIGMLLAAGAAIAPTLLKPVQKVWMTLALCMGFVMTRVILFVLFFLFLTPIAVIARLSGKKFLDLAFRETKESYWTLHRQRVDKSEYENQF